MYDEYRTRQPVLLVNLFFPLADEINMAAKKVAMKIILLTYSGRAILL
jgi:uncharacterized protein YhhL (DUF1145 family)